MITPIPHTQKGLQALALNVMFTDDLDCAMTADETVTFELDEVRYEIDLSRRNAMQLRRAMEPWINAARRTGGRRARRAPTEPQAHAHAHAHATIAAERRAAIRKWARNNGYGVAVYGRIPRKVLQAYTAAVNRQ